jgi:Zn-dependent peptidase ImmA (M78 family)
VLEWAIARSRLDPAELGEKVPQLTNWLSGDRSPTFRQLEAFANRTRTPIGLLMLNEPPVDELPIPDFRTIGNEAIEEPSADLLDTIALCELRQEWYRQYQIDGGHEPLAFVGSASLDTPVRRIAREMTVALNFAIPERGSSWSAALTNLIDSAETFGVLVMVSGVVGSNTSRPLDPDEFRGFALADPFAPVAFVNGRDTKAAQIFTLAHELAHLWLGTSGVSDPNLALAVDDEHEVDPVERWCNGVAAEFLAPAQLVRLGYDDQLELTVNLERLAREFKVSTLVVLRRLFELDYMSRRVYWREFEAERARVLELVGEGSSGGNFYNTTPRRVSKLFARALIASTLEGRTTYSTANRLLGFRAAATFNELAHRLGVV